MSPNELYAPHIRREQELTFVGFKASEKYHEFGVDSEFLQ